MIIKQPILLIISLFASLTILGQTGVIKGHIYDKREEKGLAYANVWLVETKIRTMTDINGNFKIDSIPNGTYNLKVSYIGYGDTIVNDLTISSNTLLSLNLELPPPCEYYNNRMNKKCPRCGKKDMVVPIVYGLPIGELDENNFFYAGCVITFCDPNWYCKRDKHKF